MWLALEEVLCYILGVDCAGWVEIPEVILVGGRLPLVKELEGPGEPASVFLELVEEGLEEGFVFTVVGVSWRRGG